MDLLYTARPLAVNPPPWAIDCFSLRLTDSDGFGLPMLVLNSTNSNVDAAESIVALLYGSAVMLAAVATVLMCAARQ